MKFVFIVNPTSGKGKALTFVDMIHTVCKDQGILYDVIMTEYKGHATEIAKKYTLSDDVVLVSVGGDGTIHEVLNGLADKVKMAILPAGTGNDTFRMLATHLSDPKEILIETLKGKFVSIDVGLANQRRFINCATMGMDADVNELAETIGKKLPIPRTLVYIVSALIVVMKPRYIDLTLDINGQTIKQKSILVAVMNGKWYGGGFTPAPAAQLQDGLFDVYLVDKAPFFRILKLLPMYMKGTHINEKEVLFIRSDACDLSTDKMTRVGTDGEVSLQTKVRFRMMKGSLSLLVPKSSELLEEI